MSALIRAGVPLPGGRLVDIARENNLPVLFSANAFMVRDRDGEIARVRLPDPVQFAGLDAALDSAGFVAAVKYHGYIWSMNQYLDLAASHDWAWYAGMDFCVEKEIAGTQTDALFRIAETCRMYHELRQAARDRGMKDPMPIIQGWTVSQYLWCIDNFPLIDWPDLIGVGSMCRRHIRGENGILAVIEALDKVLPPNTKLHCFGIKGPVMEIIGKHPRLASIDSLAWDFAARRDHPVGRTMDLRGSYMLDWVSKNTAAVERAKVYQHTPSLFPPEAAQPSQELSKWLDLVTSNEISGPDAALHASRGFIDHRDMSDEDEPESDDEEEISSMGMAA